MTQGRLPRILSIFLFAIYVVGGLLVSRDYGAGIDEMCQRYIGGINSRAILETFYPSFVEAHPEVKNLIPLEEYFDRHYGAAFEVPLAVAEKALGISEDSPQLFYMRHILTFLFCSLAAVSFWLMVRRRLKSEWWALLGSAAFVLTPRFFADSFYNSKDLVFLSSFVICMAAIQLFMDRRTLMTAIWAGFTAALATDIRNIGVMLPAVIIGIMAWEWITSGKERRPLKRELTLLVTLVASFTIFTYVMWPFLWPDPFGNFIYSIHKMGQNVWRGSEIFMGHYQDVTLLPWYYIPVWVGITMPLLYVPAFVGAVGMILYRVLRSRIRLFTNDGQRFDLIALLLFLGAPLAAIVMGSVLYNGWRQMYFIGGPFVYLSIVALHELASRWPKHWKGGIVKGMLVAQLASNFFFILWMHPHQYVFFNLMSGPNHAQNFEMDYWGMSYREALEYVASNDPGDSISIRSLNYTAKLDENFLTPEQRARVHVHVSDSLFGQLMPDYYLTTHPSDLPHPEAYKVVHEVKAGPETINWVYKRSVPQVVLEASIPSIPDSTDTEESRH